MPVIKSAIKKLRKDRVREKKNDILRNELDKTINAAKREKTAKSVSAAHGKIDRAVKNHLVNKNTAARMKSSLSRLAKPEAGTKKTTAPKKVESKPAEAKKATPKKAAKKA